MLVERERLEADGLVANFTGRAERRKEARWAHSSPLIERGSVLLAAPGDHFSLDQQYFHKAVILIVKHSDAGTMGLILNRPTAFNVGDATLQGKKSSSPIDMLLDFFSLQPTWDSWGVWFGGDCEGPGSPMGDRALSCLHTAERFGAISEQIIKGIYLIDLMQARALVMSGQASAQDFMVLVGYCGWGPGQLQAELSRGDSWIMASASKRAVLGDIPAANARVSSRLRAASERNRPLAATELGDGVREWRRLLADVEGGSINKTAEDEHADAVLQRWIERSLITSQPDALGGSAGSATRLKAGSVLRASATAWLLGAPTSGKFAPRGESYGLQAAQYLHKAVLLLLEDSSPRGTSSMVLLNGPKIGAIVSASMDVYFGGTQRPDAGGLLELPGGGSGILGRVSLPPGRLEGLVALGALEVAQGINLGKVLEAPPERRWEAAGGTIDSIADAVTARLGDEQRRKWYQRFLGTNLPADL